MTDRLQRYFVIYEAAHRTRMCRISHVIGIPLILFTTYAALDWIPLFEVPGTGGFTFSFGHLWYLGMLVWYSRLSLGLTALMAAIGVGVFALSPLVPWPVVAAVWGGAWVVQLSGHLVWEGNRPAFFESYAQMYIGPIFFLALLLSLWPVDRAAPAAASPPAPGT